MKKDLLYVIGMGLVLLSALFLFCYFTIWAVTEKMANGILLIGVIIEFVGAGLLYLSETITDESLLLTFSLFLVSIASSMISVSEEIIGALIMICFFGIMYFIFRRNNKNKTAPPQSVAAE